jgi:hypothetical protein
MTRHFIRTSGYNDRAVIAPPPPGRSPAQTAEGWIAIREMCVAFDLRTSVQPHITHCHGGQFWMRIWRERTRSSELSIPRPALPPMPFLIVIVVIVVIVGWAERRNGSCDRVIGANRIIPLACLCPKGGVRGDRYALKRFAQGTVTRCDRDAINLARGIASEAEAIDQLVAQIEACWADQGRRARQRGLPRPICDRLRDMRSGFVEGPDLIGGWLTGALHITARQISDCRAGQNRAGAVIFRE